MTQDPSHTQLSRFVEALRHVETVRATGIVEQVVGLLIESKGPPAGVGDFCEIRTREGAGIRTQVIGFRDGRVLSMPLEETGGLQPGDTVVSRKRDARVGVSGNLLGRVLDGFGMPMDGGPPIPADDYYDLYCRPSGSAGTGTDYRAAHDWRPRNRQFSHLRARAAYRYLRRQRGGQEHSAWVAPEEP